MVANRKMKVIAGILAAIGLITWAWIDGGERAVHPIVQDVPLPETAK